MSEMINIGTVKVPLLDYAVSCTAILGIRDSGKTVTAKGIAEQLLEHHIPIIVFDAVGKWRWMKVPGVGRHPKGFKVVVAGGRAPDLALSPQSVGEIVRSAVKEKIPLIIDLYDPKLSKADWRRIVQQSIRIIHYEANGVAHVFLEEAAEFIPQKVMDGETYAEVEKLARMGGNASVGITLINQRSQEVNKAVLDLAHNLVLGCQIGNKAIEAVEKWVDRLSPDTAKAVTTSLPHLKSGEAWVWTRSNPDEPSREKLPMCRSLHPDRRTPDVVLKTAKAIDPEEFVTRLNVAIPKLVEEAKANDPAILKRRIAELEKQAKAPVKAGPAPEPENVYVVTKDDYDVVDRTMLACSQLHAYMEQSGKELSERFTDLRRIRERLDALSVKRPTVVVPLSRHSVPRTAAAAGERHTGHRQTHDNGVTLGISPVAQRILNALAELELLGASQPVREMVALMANYTNLASTGFVKAIGELRTAGHISYPNSDTIALTSSGQSSANYPAAPRSSEDIQQRICSILGGKSSEVLRPLIDAYPNAVDRMDVAAAAGYTNLASTGFVKVIGRLRSLGFIDYPDTKTMVATSVLFLNE